MAKNKTNSSGPYQGPPPPNGRQGGGQAGSIDERAGRRHEVVRRGGHQQPRGTSRAASSRATMTGARSSNRGRRELPPRGGPRPQRWEPGPNPTARQAGAPRARPPRDQVTYNQRMRCSGGCPTSPQWRYCPLCGNPLPLPKPFHNNSYHEQPPRAGSAYDGPSLKARYPPRASERTPPSRRTVNPTSLPRPEIPPRSYVEAVHRRPSAPPMHNSRGAIRPSRNHTAPRVCVCGCVDGQGARTQPIQHVQYEQAHRGRANTKTGV